MNIVICGAGQVGSHAAEILAKGGHAVTVIDTSPGRVLALEESLDVRTLCGSCSDGEVLRRAGSTKADLVIATTSNDEVNVLSASIAKKLGARKVIARVHHRAFFEKSGFDYETELGIDRLICPEYSTAQAIARTLHHPGALAIENFARGRIEVQEFQVSAGAPALGRPLSEVRLPAGARLAAVRRHGFVFLPDASTRLEPEDTVVLVGNPDVFDDAREKFNVTRTTRYRLIVMGGPSMAVWLCRALKGADYSIRLFEEDITRAEELAMKLHWVTVLHANPTDPAIFEEERVADADAFLALTDDDEQNILGSAWAKSMGVKKAIAVVQSPTYLHLLAHVGIDEAFNPRIVAAREIEDILDHRPLRRLAELPDGVLDVYLARVGADSEVIGQPLRQVAGLPIWIVAGIQRGTQVFVPTADDSIQAGDSVIVIVPHDSEPTLAKILKPR